MKKFFKALALVLALVLVIGAIPASAAINFSLKKDTKIVYLGGSKGLKEDGTQCGTTSKYRISKLINGFDAETMYLKLESSDKTIVKTNNSKRKVYGKKIGEAVVTIYIYDKESDALLDTLQPTVKVKKNATTIQYAVTDANGDLVDPTEKFGLNTPYTLTLSRKDAAGNLTDTDYRAITCVSDNKADVEITPANDYTTKYTITFKKAGKFDFVAATYQSKIWNAPILAVPVPTVEAGYTPVDAKQVALNAAAVTFESNVTGLTADNFNAYYEVNDTKVYPTAAQTVVCKDNVATVTFLSDFIPGFTYFIEYDGKVAGSFPAAKITADAAEHIEIPAQEITVGVPTKLTFKIVDANGIDIKSLLGTTLNGILTFELEKGDIDTYITSGYEPEVYIGTVGKSYTVKAVYTWIDANGKEKKAEGTGLVASVVATPWKMGQVAGLISAYNETAPADTKAYIVDAKVNGDAKAVEHWAIGDSVVLQIGVPYTKGNDTKIESIETAGTVAGEYKAYELLSGNDNIVMIGKKKSVAGVADNAYELIANKVGSTSIVVYGVKADDSKVAIGVIGVNVESARTATTFTVTPSKKSINSAFDGDSITFKLNVKDQYGADMTKAIKVEVINKVAGTTPTFAYDDPNNYSLSTGDFDVIGTDFVGKGTVNLKFSVKDTSLVQTVVLDVGNEADAKTYVLKLSGTTLDTGITNEKDVTKQKPATVSVSLEGKTASGYVTSGTAIDFSSTTYKTRSTTSASIDGPEYYFNIIKDGQVVSSLANFNATTNVFTNIIADTDATHVVPGTTSPTAVKLAAGTYTIIAYSQTLNAAKDTIVVSQIGTQNLVVTDNQIQGKFERLDNAESLADVITEANIASAFKITFNGVEITDADFEFTPNNEKVPASSTSSFVKTATFYVGNESVNYQKIVVTIGEVVRKAK